MMAVLLAAVLLLAAASGAAVVLSRDPRRQVFALAGNGLVLTLLFLVLQAPDVALSELAVGTAATPLLFLAALAAVRINRKRNAADLSTEEKHDRVGEPTRSRSCLGGPE